MEVSRYATLTFHRDSELLIEVAGAEGVEYLYNRLFYIILNI